MANFQRVGYVRVSTAEQNEERQLEGIRAATLDRVFTDKASGGNTSREALKAMQSYVRSGDTLVVHSMDRLARNLDDLRHMVHELTARGVRIEFTKEGLVFTGEDAPMSKLLLSVMGAFAEFERALIRERQREGIELAKKRGVYKGRKQKLPADKRKELRTRASNGERKAALAREFGISRETLYQYLRENQGVGGEYQKTDFH